MATPMQQPGRQQAPLRLSRRCHRHMPTGACLLGSWRYVGPPAGATLMMRHLLCSLRCRDCWGSFVTPLSWVRMNLLPLSPTRTLVTCHTVLIHEASLHLPSAPDVVGALAAAPGIAWEGRCEPEGPLCRASAHGSLVSAAAQGCLRSLAAELGPDSHLTVTLSSMLQVWCGPCHFCRCMRV